MAKESAFITKLSHVSQAAFLDVKIFLNLIERIVVPFVLNGLGLRGNNKFPPVLLRLDWLDRQNSSLIKNFLEEKEEISYGPRISENFTDKKVKIPAVNLYRFTNAKCCGSSSSVIYKNRLILERVHGSDPRRCNYACGYVRRHGVLLANVCYKYREHVQKGIFLGGNGASNYYHWMVELAPKFEFIARLGAEYNDYPLLVDEAVVDAQNLLEVLNFFRGDRSVVSLKSSTLYCVQDLLYLNAPSIVPFNLRGTFSFRADDFLCRVSSVMYMRNMLLPLGEYSSLPCDFGKRLFLSRKSYRRNYNQDEIFDVFKKEGFIQVFLEDYDLKGQIRMISQAEMLAGPSGAAWTNLIFCTKGAKCICWMDRKLSDFSSFSNLARSVGVDLIYVTYSSEISMTAEFYAADYHLPVEKIEKALHQMLLCYS